MATTHTRKSRGFIQKHTGQEYSTDEVREFAASLELLDFLVQDAAGKNIR